jgi:hypothetical protein
MKVSIGQVFGRWTLLALSSRRVSPPYWTSRCSCGVVREVKQAHLKSGASRSCGCLSREMAGDQFRTHGESKIPEYWVWCAMLRRCYNKNSTSYKYYGGRGISVCARWRKSYQKFMEDVGRRPSQKHTLDRINNDGNYEPGNVRWATSAEQALNRRSNRLVTVQGETHAISVWANRTGINVSSIYRRAKRGMSLEAAVTAPVKPPKKTT